MKKYKLTPEHQAQLDPWVKRWVAIILNTTSLTDKDKELCTTAINGLYKAAKLQNPKKVIFVPSPFVARTAGARKSVV